MLHVHETISGQRVEYPEPEPDVAAYLERVRATVADAGAGVEEVRMLVYGEQNPILDTETFGRPMVTHRVLEEPLWYVLADLLLRKELAVRGQDPAHLAAQHTLTVAEAAQRLGLTEEDIRDAIAKRRLPAWMKDTEPTVNPRSLALFEANERARRGR